MRLPISIAAILLSAVLAGAGCNSKPPANPPEVKVADGIGPKSSPAPLPFFRDVTDETGVAFTYRNGQEAGHYAILESLGGGAILIDYDGDGLLDIFLPGGGYFDGPDKRQIKGHPCRMFRNRGNLKFEDVTAAVGLDGISFFTHGGAVADINCDGFPDLLVTGYGRVALFENVPDGSGGRKFKDVTRAAGLLGNEGDKLSPVSGQLGPHFWSTSAAFGDLDGDGYPDLYVCQYVDWSFQEGHNPPCPGYSPEIKRDVCPPKRFNAVAHALYRNNCNGTFTNVSEEAGLHLKRIDANNLGKGLGVLMIDVDGDHKPDIYVANDTTDNFLYLNRSEPGKLRFVERGRELGVATDGFGIPNGSMGVDAADVDGSGRPSIWVTNYENEYHALYRNSLYEGRMTFGFATSAFGLATIGPSFVGFGTVFVDVDRDGWEDIVISNGHVVRHPPRGNLRQRPVLYLNSAKGEGRWFIDSKDLGGTFFQQDQLGRGLAAGDLDNDGKIDLVFAQLNEPTRLLRNVSPDGNHWLGIKLVAKDNRDIVGARVTLEANGRRLVRFAKGGGSYLSANDPRIVFGLGSVSATGRVIVEWPSGQPAVQEFDDLAVDQYHRLVQGK
jgi:hypothetical protein